METKVLPIHERQNGSRNKLSLIPHTETQIQKRNKKIKKRKIGKREKSDYQKFLIVRKKEWEKEGKLEGVSLGQFTKMMSEEWRKISD